MMNGRDRTGTGEAIMLDELARFGEGGLTFEEFAMSAPVPLSAIHGAVLEFLRGRGDAVLFGAHAVNVYVREPRMTQDVDVVSTRAAELAEELRAFLNARFHIAVRTRAVRDGIGYRVYQLQKPANRHLADVRPVDVLPPSQVVAGVAVVTPAELIAGKVRAFHGRRGQPKSGTDWRDLALLLLAFPELKTEQGPVRERLEAGGAGPDVLDVWRQLVVQPIAAEEEEDEDEET
jgi:hypothetical protein